MFMEMFYSHWRLLFFITYGIAAVYSQERDLVIYPGGVQWPVIAPLNSNLMYICTINFNDPSPDLSLKWYSPSGSEITERSSRISTERDGETSLKLFITDIELEDQGTYSCKGMIDGRLITRTRVVNVFQDITFVEAPTLQYAVVGDATLIVCRVTGTPTPNVSWRKGGRQMEHGSGRYVVAQDGLIIANVSPDDAGEYTCRAEVFEYGTFEQRTITLEVHDKMFKR